jgi:hypothetical protein
MHIPSLQEAKFMGSDVKDVYPSRPLTHQIPHPLSQTIVLRRRKSLLGYSVSSLIIIARSLSRCAVCSLSRSCYAMAVSMLLIVSRSIYWVLPVVALAAC